MDKKRSYRESRDKVVSNGNIEESIFLWYAMGNWRAGYAASAAVAAIHQPNMYPYLYF